DGRLPGDGRPLLGPGVAPALFVGDAVVMGPAPVRPVVGGRDGRRQDDDQEAGGGSHGAVPPDPPSNRSGSPDGPNTPTRRGVVPRRRAPCRPAARPLSSASGAGARETSTEGGGMDIEHMALNVPDPVAMADWYTEHLGMRVVRSVPGPPHTRFLAD